MAEGAIQVGDRVISLQVPGVFSVVARRDGLLEIENERGVRMIVSETGVRRLEEPPVVKDG